MFSPLALTQTLPFLPLAQGDIDYQVARRGDPDLFDTLFADPVTKVILVRGGLLAVPRGQGNAVNYASANMRLSTLPGAYAGSALAVHPEVVPIFLGSYGALRNEHVVALDITRMSAPGAASAIPSPSLGADAAFDADGNAPGAVAPDRLDMLEQAVERFDWVDLRGFAAHANAREAGQATTAVTLRGSGQGGDGWMVAAVHERGRREPSAVPPHRARCHHRDRGQSGPAALAAQQRLAQSAAVLRVGGIRRGGGEP